MEDWNCEITRRIIGDFQKNKSNYEKLFDLDDEMLKHR